MVKEMDFDILGETHLQDHVQHSLHLQFPNHHLIHSPGRADKHFSGVSFIINKACCWAYKPLQWSHDHPCHEFAQDNRLLGLQLWIGDGKQCLFI